MSDDYKRLLNYIIARRLAEFYCDIWELACKYIEAQSKRNKFRNDFKIIWKFYEDEIKSYTLLEDC